MRDVSIEPLTPELAPCFESLNRAWIESWFELEEPDRVMLARPERLVEAGGAVLFARDAAGEVVGTGGLERLDAATVEVVKMAVREDQRGRGIGARLLEALLAEARRLGYREVRIETSSKLAAANALYRRFGFQPVAQAESAHGFARADRFYALRLDR